MPIVSALRTALRLTGFALLAALPTALFAQSQAADGFDPNVNGIVYAVALQQTDGKIIIGGKFSTLQPNGALSATSRSNLARLNPDGTVDPTFAASANDQVSVIVLQPDGSILIAGKFTSVNGITRNHVARLKPDGTLDSFDPNILKWSTSIGDLTPAVYALAVDASGRVLVGGDFSTVQPDGGDQATRNYLARFNSDGTLDPSFNPDPNSSVTAFALLSDGRILIGGKFTSVGGVDHNRLARLSADGVLDSSFDPNPDGAVNAIVVRPDGVVLIGGSFDTLTPNGSDAALSHTYLAALNPDGTTATWDGSADGAVGTMLLLPDGRLLVGGTFNTASGLSYSYAARLLPNGDADNIFAPLPNFTVYGFASQSDGSVILVGGFTTLKGYGVNSLVRNHVARVSPIGTPDTNFSPDVNGRLETAALQTDGKLLIGGTFTSVAGATHDGIVRLETDGTVDGTFTAAITGYVATIVQQGDGKILVGGSFTRVNGISRDYLARLNADGTLDTAFDPVLNSAVSSLAVQSDGKILVGGSFSAIEGHGDTAYTIRNYIARLNADGTLDTTFDPEGNGAVNAIYVQADGKILLGGSFSSFLPNGATAYTYRYGMVRLNADGTVDSAFNPNINGTVLTMAVQSDGSIVFGGTFQQMAPNQDTTVTYRSNIARITSAGAVDTTFDPHANGPILSVAVQPDGKILVGGYYTLLQPNGGAAVDAFSLARLNADGTVDSGFGVKIDRLPGNEVRDFLFPDSNHVIIAGSFTTVTSGSTTFANSRVARLGLDGTIDTSFRSDLSTASGASIESIVIENDDRVLLGGTFSELGGTTVKNLAEFLPEGTPNTNFNPSVNGPVHTMAILPDKGEPIETQAQGFGWFDENGGLLSSFAFTTATVAVASVYNIEVQSDGKILIAGNMSIDETPDDSSDSWSSVALARFNPDGSLDSSFKPLDYDSTNYSVSVYSTLVQSDGKILVAGSFSDVAIQSTFVYNLIRLNADGTLDTTFLPTPNSTVYALLEQPDGKILIGGDFSTVRPDPNNAAVTRGGIARLNADGSLDTSFDPEANGSVYTIYQKSDGKLLVGGSFSSFRPNGASTSTTRYYIAEFNNDGTLTSQDFSADGVVSAIVPQSDGKILLGGYFSNLDSTSVDYLARINSDDSIDASFNPNPNGAVPSIAVLPDGKIVIGGSFTALQPNGGSVYDPSLATPRSYIARINPDGTVDAAFNPNLDSDVTRVVAYPDGTVLAAGGFIVTQPSGSIIIGGTFDNINNSNVSNVALFGSDGSISSAIQPNPDGGVYALLPLPDDSLIMAGAFNTFAGVTRHHIARYNADNSLNETFDPNANGDVYVVAYQPDGKLLAGGAFTAIGGGLRSYVARLNDDGTLDASFNASVSGTVRALALQPDGKVLILSDGTGGTGSVLARFDASGNADATFPAVNGGADAIDAFALQDDGRIVVGGSFTTIAGVNHPYLARLTATGTLDPSLTAVPNGPVTALSVERDGKVFIAGEFSAVDGLPRNGLARLAAALPPTDSITLNNDRTSATWTHSGGGPEIYSAIAETSPDATTWTTLGPASRISGTSNWLISGLDTTADTGLYVRVTGLVASASNTAVGQVQTFGGFYVIPTPVISSATVVGGVSGSEFIYAIAATDLPTSYSATGLPAGLQLNSATGLIIGTPTQSGTFDVNISATNDYGTGPVAVLRIVIAATPPTPATVSRFSNISVNAQITPTDPIIAGFVIGGTAPQSVLLRAVGPTLAHFGITNYVPAPHLRLFNSTGHILLDNSGWNTDSDLMTTFTRLGAYPLDEGSTDAAAVVTLPPGVYTMHVFDNTGATGTALAEVYDASTTVTDLPRLMNLSGRSVVDVNNRVAIGGFVIAGDTPKKVLIRGVGPGLTAQGVTNALSDPAIKLFSGSTPIATNDNWETPVALDPNYPPASASDLSAAAATAGAFALDAGSKDAAILVTLAPGVYTVHLSGVNDAEGSALAEIYELP